MRGRRRTTVRPDAGRIAPSATGKRTMRSLFAIVLSGLLFAACAEPGRYGYGADQPTGPYYGAPAGAYTGPQATYSCEDLTTVLVQPGVGIATVTLNSGSEFRLRHNGGGVYGQQSHVFRQHGNEASWFADGRPAVRCRMMTSSR